MISKLLPGHETLVAIPATEVNGEPQLLGDTMVSIENPTSAVINRWLTVLTNESVGAGSGGNISCATADDLNLGLTDSEVDDSRSLCSVGSSGTLTFYNFDAELNIFRDIDPLDPASDYNMANDLFRAPDVPYILAHRIGYDQNTLAAPGQEWDFYYVWTDNPVPDFADGENQATNVVLISKNLVNISHTLTS